MLVFLLLVIVGVALVINAVKRQRRLTALSRTPTTPIADLRNLPPDPCTPYEVHGTAHATDEPLRAPLSGVPCVWFRVRIVDCSRQLLNWGQRSQRQVRDARTEAPFVLDDGTGRVRVNVRGADVVAGPTRFEDRERAEAGPGGFLDGSLAARVLGGGLPGTPPALKPGREYEYEEWVLEDGAATYALGSVHGTGDDLTLGAPGVAHLIGAGDEHQVRSGLNRSLLLGYGLGIPLVVVGGAMLLFALSRLTQ